MYPNRNKTLLIIVNEDQYFVSHRMKVGEGAVAEGWRVIVAAAPKSGCEEEIRSKGMEFYPLPIDGDGIGLKTQWGTLIRLISLMKQHRDAVAHFVGMKMLLVGNVAKRLARHRGGVVNAVCGMGHMFRDPDRFMPRLLLLLLRMVWQRNNIVTIVQNHDDEALLKQRKVIRDSEVEYIKGSGVILDNYYSGKRPVLTPEGKIRVIFTGRLLRSKGVADFISAAEILRPKWENKAEFLICGGVSTNADSMTPEEMERATDGTYLIWAGNRRDVAILLSESRIMAFPGYYREGVPLSLIEASAAGLPIVTCNSVGCRDTIDGNGIMVEPRHPEQVAEAIERLLNNPDECERMGLRSRELAERDYDIRKVVEKHLSIYNSLLRGR